TNLSTVLEYTRSNILLLTGVQYLARVNSDISTTELREQIYTETGASTLTIDFFIENYLESPGRRVLLTTLNGSILMLLTVVVFTILMFGFTQLVERNKEIGVERALGMNLKQTALLFMLEAMVLLIFGMVVGVILGMAISQVFLMNTLLLQVNLYPPYLLHYPWDLFAGVSILILGVGLISSVVPAFLATRVKISNILRTE
ncbi:MAG: ABC transporter permease, partial [Candidatus Hodarchaeota archaeon]